MVKYVKYIHFFLIVIVELGCNETEEESLPHTGVKAFTNVSMLVLSLLCASHDYIPVLFDLKSAFF